MTHPLDTEIRSAELRAVLEALARALGDRPPRPDLVEGAVPACAEAVPGHRVRIVPGPGETPHPGDFLLEITVDGPRAQGRWSLTGARLADLLAALRDAPSPGLTVDGDAPGREPGPCARKRLPRRHRRRHRHGRVLVRRRRGPWRRRRRERPAERGAEKGTWKTVLMAVALAAFYLSTTDLFRDFVWALRKEQGTPWGVLEAMRQAAGPPRDPSTLTRDGTPAPETPTDLCRRAAYSASGDPRLPVWKDDGPAVGDGDGRTAVSGMVAFRNEDGTETPPRRFRCETTGEGRVTAIVE